MSKAPKGKIVVELQEWMGSDFAVANAAWSSTYDKDIRDDRYDEPEKIAKVIRDVITGGHNVPVESVIFRFWIRFPIFADRQHMTHRIQSANGLSGRYRTLPDDWFPVPQDVREIMEKVKTGCSESVCDEFDERMAAQQKFYREWLGWCREAEKAGRISNGEYKRVREIARGVIGTASMTERTTILNLGSFCNYQRRRNDPHAQAEIRYVAQEMLRLVKEKNIAPVTIATLEEVGWRL